MSGGLTLHSGILTTSAREELDCFIRELDEIILRAEKYKQELIAKKQTVVRAELESSHTLDLTKAQEDTQVTTPILKSQTGQKDGQDYISAAEETLIWPRGAEINFERQQDTVVTSEMRSDALYCNQEDQMRANNYVSDFPKNTLDEMIKQVFKSCRYNDLQLSRREAILDGPLSEQDIGKLFEEVVDLLQKAAPDMADRAELHVQDVAVLRPRKSKRQGFGHLIKITFVSAVKKFAYVGALQSLFRNDRRTYQGFHLRRTYPWSLRKEMHSMQLLLSVWKKRQGDKTIRYDIRPAYDPELGCKLVPYVKNMNTEDSSMTWQRLVMEQEGAADTPDDDAKQRFEAEWNKYDGLEPLPLWVAVDESDIITV